MDAFGRVDIVICNAGIIRDVSFHKMKESDWQSVMAVHLEGAFKVVRAAWNPMREQRYGRVILTSSAAGLYGNFGQVNYAAAKLALVGLARTLAIEGQRRGINVNAVAPVAGTRITATVLPEDLLQALKPEAAAPVVGWLCHEDCDTTGAVIETGAGWSGALRVERSPGAFFSDAVGGSQAGADPEYVRREFTPEKVLRKWGEVMDFGSGSARSPEHPSSNQDAIMKIMELVQQLPEKPADAATASGASAGRADASTTVSCSSSSSSGGDEAHVASSASTSSASASSADGDSEPFEWSAAAEGMASAAVFKVLRGAMAVHGEDLRNKVDSRIMFRIKPDGRWLLDLKSRAPPAEGTSGPHWRLVEVPEGSKPEVDVVLAVKDEDFMALVAGTSSPQGLWMQGKLKVKGSLQVAGRLAPVFKAAKKFSTAKL